MTVHQYVGCMVTAAPQSPSETPRDLALLDELARLVLGLATRMHMHRRACAAEFDLTPALAKALDELEPGQPVPMRELAQRLGCDPSNLTGLIDRLEARGAVQRRPDSNDRRVKALALTEEGVRLRDAFWIRLLADAGPLSQFSHDQAVALRDVLSAAKAADRGH